MPGSSCAMQCDGKNQEHRQYQCLIPLVPCTVTPKIRNIDKNQGLILLVPCNVMAKISNIDNTNAWFFLCHAVWWQKSATQDNINAWFLLCHADVMQWWCGTFVTAPWNDPCCCCTEHSYSLFPWVLPPLPLHCYSTANMESDPKERTPRWDRGTVMLSSIKKKNSMMRQRYCDVI